MKNLIKTCSRALMAVALGIPGFANETGFDISFKARGGYGLKSADNLTHRVIGMGLEMGYTTSVGRFAAELGFQYKPGDRWLYDISKAPMEPGTVYVAELVPGVTPNYPTNGNLGGGYSVTTYGAVSADIRSNRVQGAMLRLSYEYPLDDLMSLRGGVQLFGSRYSQEVLANAIYQDPEGHRFPNGLAVHIVDVYGGKYEVNDAAPSPYIGIKYKIATNIALEVNLFGMGYKAVEYVHVLGTGSRRPDPYDPTNPDEFNDYEHNPWNNVSKDSVKEKSTMVPHIEIGFAFRF